MKNLKNGLVQCLMEFGQERLNRGYEVLRVSPAYKKAQGKALAASGKVSGVLGQAGQGVWNDFERLDAEREDMEKSHAYLQGLTEGFLLGQLFGELASKSALVVVQDEGEDAEPAKAPAPPRQS